MNHWTEGSEGIAPVLLLLLPLHASNEPTAMKSNQRMERMRKRNSSWTQSESQSERDSHTLAQKQCDRWLSICPNSLSHCESLSLAVPCASTIPPYPLLLLLLSSMKSDCILLSLFSCPRIYFYVIKGVT